MHSCDTGFTLYHGPDASSTPGTTLSASMQPLAQLIQLADYPAASWAPSPPELADMVVTLTNGSLSDTDPGYTPASITLSLVRV